MERVKGGNNAARKAKRAHREHSGEPIGVLKLDGKVVCKLCGAQLDLPEGETPKVTFHAVTGGPLTRVLHIGAAEVHRCDVVPPRS